MKKNDRSIKKVIKNRIELQQGKKNSPNKRIRKKQKNEMGVRDKLRIGGTPPPKHMPVDLVSRSAIRRGENINVIKYNIKDYGKYVKSEDVDYDAIIYISSYNRYDKLEPILNQLFSQETIYSFKIIVMNDGSEDKRYFSLKNKFRHITYLKNKTNGGKRFYWKTINTILEEVKKYKCHAVIQMDDDFILCDNFIDGLVNKYFEIKSENNSYMLFKYHLGALDINKIDENTFFNPDLCFQGVDGGTMFDTEFLKMMGFNINDTKDWMKYGGSGVWNYLNDKIIEFGVMVYTFRESLVFHDGNDCSVMHSEIRKKRKYNTINYVGNQGKTK